MKKLYKSNNRTICGVCAGIAALVMPENMDVM